MKKRIIFATGNENKMKEIRMILADLGLEILSMKEAGVFEEIEEGEDISMALLPKSTSRIVLIGNDVRWKHLVEEEINLVGVLTLEDLHILLEQSMYEI